MMYTTAAPLNALAMVSRRLNQRLLCGRLVFPDEGGMFMVTLTHRYDTVPGEFDSVYVVSGLLDVNQAVIDIATEHGYVL